MIELLFYGGALALFVIVFNADYIVKQPAALLLLALVFGALVGLVTMWFAHYVGQ